MALSIAGVKNGGCALLGQGRVRMRTTFIELSWGVRLPADAPGDPGRGVEMAGGFAETSRRLAQERVLTGASGYAVQAIALI